jgi:hypothetical protein
MDEMILIPKILESVTCNVYKSRVAALMKYMKFFSIFSAKREYNSLNTVKKTNMVSELTN